MMRDKTICSLDIGSAKIVAACAKVNRQGKMELLATQIAESRGINRGAVSDLASLSDCLAQVRQSLFKKSGIKPQEVFVGVKGTYFKTKSSKTVIPLLDRGDKVITSNDIKRVNHQAMSLGIDIEEEVLHEIPQSYTLDDYNVVKNPLGLYSRKMGVDLLLITSPMGHLDNFIKALNQAGWGVGRLVFSSLAASSSVLSNEEKENGCALIDMGAGSTEILVFKDGILREVNILPYGGIDFTDSIAGGLKLTFDLAEEIKKSYAVATSEEVNEDEDILIKKSSEYSPIKRKKLSEAIEPSIAHLLKLIKERLDRSAFRKYFNSGVVVTGGNSLLCGFLEQAESLLGLPVKMGKIKEFSLSYYKVPVYASVLGLLKFAASGLTSDTAAFLVTKKLTKGFFSRIKELYQEYF